MYIVNTQSRNLINKNMIFLNSEINMLLNKKLNIKALKLKFTRRRNILFVIGSQLDSRRNILFVIGSQLDNQILLRLTCKTVVVSLSLRANFS